MLVLEVLDKEDEGHEAEDPEEVDEHAAEILQNAVALVPQTLKVRVGFVRTVDEGKEVGLDRVGRDDVEVRNVVDELVEGKRVHGELDVQQRHVDDELHDVDHAPEHLKGCGPEMIE